MVSAEREKKHGYLHGLCVMIGCDENSWSLVVIKSLPKWPALAGLLEKWPAKSKPLFHVPIIVFIFLPIKQCFISTCNRWSLSLDALSILIISVKTLSPWNFLSYKCTQWAKIMLSYCISYILTALLTAPKFIFLFLILITWAPMQRVGANN